LLRCVAAHHSMYAAEVWTRSGNRAGLPFVIFVSRVSNPGYNITKEAIRSLTRTAAREWARHAITVNAVEPHLGPLCRRVEGQGRGLGRYVGSAAFLDARRAKDFLHAAERWHGAKERREPVRPLRGTRRAMQRPQDASMDGFRGRTRWTNSGAE
jgi:NAD(P)-dependent dehydrogenase (short-subunit alcohol dehydrogenase family)